MVWGFHVACVAKDLEWRKAIARGMSEMCIAIQKISLVNFVRKPTRIMTH